MLENPIERQPRTRVLEKVENKSYNNIRMDTIIKTPKNQFIENIQRWATIDSQLKIINEKTKKLREMKNAAENDICKYMSENNLANKKINISNGELKMVEKKEYSSLNYGYIERCLSEIIPDKSHVDYIIQYLKEKREITVVQELKRM